MKTRRGERMGWIGGWIGAFLWVAVLAVVFLARGRVESGLAGLAIAAAAGVAAGVAAPWRHPNTPYWKLMLPLYAGVVASVAWAVLSFGLESLRSEGASPWLLAVLVPLGLPWFSVGRRRWTDGEK